VPDDLLPTTRRALLHQLALSQREGRAPSLVAGVVREGRLAWSDVRGEVDGGTDAAYRIGSLTKTFTAVLVLQLRDEGRLQLSDPVGQHLPEIGGAVTLLQLLNHSAGVTSELPGAWWERVAGGDFPALAAALAGEPSRLEPGARLHYSNVGFGLLGEVVARLRGTSWAEALRTRLLDPLQLTRTTLLPEPPHAAGWAVHPHADVLLPEPAHDAGAMAPAGQLWSTVGDLARWARFLGGDTGGVLDPLTLEEMRQPGPVDDAPAWSTAWGLGLQLRTVDGRRLVGHGGSMPGFVAALWVEPTTGDAAVALANATSGGAGPRASGAADRTPSPASTTTTRGSGCRSSATRRGGPATSTSRPSSSPGGPTRRAPWSRVGSTSRAGVDPGRERARPRPAPRSSRAGTPARSPPASRTAAGRPRRRSGRRWCSPRPGRRAPRRRPRCCGHPRGSSG
jgi:CubicO group peptidase (beta-lactamase class C family)